MDDAPPLVQRFTAAPASYDLPTTRTVEVLPLYEGEHQIRCVEMPAYTVHDQESAYIREFFDFAEKSQLERWREIGLITEQPRKPA